MTATARQIHGGIEGVAAVALLHGAKGGTVQLQHAFPDQGYFFGFFHNEICF